MLRDTSDNFTSVNDAVSFRDTMTISSFTMASPSFEKKIGWTLSAGGFRIYLNEPYPQ